MRLLGDVGKIRLQWCRGRSTWNCADWGRIVFSGESRFLLCSDDRRKRVWRRPGLRVDPGLTVEHLTGPQQGVMVWGAISFDSKTPLVVIPGTLTAKRRLQSSRNVDYLARQLETIWQEIPQHTIRNLYQSMTRRVAACIQAINFQPTNDLRKAVCMVDPEWLVQRLKSPSVVGPYDALVVQADPTSTPFFLKHGFTDDLILCSRFRHVCDGRQDTVRNETRYETIRPQSAQFQVDRSRRHCSRTCRSTDVRGKHRNGRKALRFRSISRLLMVILDTCVPVTRLMVDNVDSGAATAILTIARSSLPVVALGRPLPS
ncbi:Transposase [Cordylochernes scorpioides]|uniref:Transposase n=1 Tax=Cordylochernes scorpioides TaxID=51811 RepID=A0ABY6KK07_9ARAC|nr:Transposase [Cordylochernes scorpioides]